MNRLKDSVCYLVGAIDKADDYGEGWRKKITPFLHSLKIKVIDPTKKKLEKSKTIKIRNKLKINKKYKKLIKIMKEIRGYDLRCCDKSDFIIVYLDTNIFSCGTMEELFLCNRSKKPVLIYTKRGLNEIPDWIWGTLPKSHLFNNIKSLKKYLLKINSGKKDKTKRWKFIQYD